MAQPKRLKKDQRLCGKLGAKSKRGNNGGTKKIWSSKRNLKTMEGSNEVSLPQGDEIDCLWSDLVYFTVAESWQGDFVFFPPYL